MFENLAGILVLCGGPVVVILAMIISYSNRLVRLEKTVEESWSNIDILLKRRSDLIPNLVSTAKGFAKHEQEVLQKLVELRESAMQSHSLAESEQVAMAITSTLKGFFARAESYPELKSSAHFLQVQQEMVDTEDRIAAARRFYNNNVREFNVAIEAFPGSLLKGNRVAKPFFMNFA